MRLSSTTFGRRLAAIRKDRGLTQFQLAGAINRSRPTVCVWESGRTPDNIRNSDLRRLAELLGCRLRDLLAPVDAPIPPLASHKRRRVNQRAAGRSDNPSPQDEVERLEVLLLEVLRRLARYEPDAVDLLDRVSPPSTSIDPRATP